MENLKRNKKFAMILGLALLIFYIYNRIYPIQLDTIEMIANGQIINFLIFLVIRTISAILCSSIAKGLNRNQTSWSIFGFILPPISLVIISLIRIKNIPISEQKSQTIIQESQDE